MLIFQSFYEYFGTIIRSHTEGEIEPEILNNILYAVPEALRLEYSNVMEDLLEEVREDYTESEKRSAGNHVDAEAYD